MADTVFAKNFEADGDGFTPFGFYTNSNEIDIGMSVTGNSFGVVATGQFAGVQATSSAGPGVLGKSTSAAAGVFGHSSDGIGVSGQSNTNNAVVGASGGAGKSGVFGFNTNTDPKAVAFGVSDTTSSPGGAGVNGFAGAGVGVNGTSDSGAGVDGESNTGVGVKGHSDTGYGGTFESVDANGVTHSSQLRIVPSGEKTPFPANPQIGEFFVKSVLIPELPFPRREGELWFFANRPGGPTPDIQNGWVRIV